MFLVLCAVSATACLGHKVQVGRQLSSSQPVRTSSGFVYEIVTPGTGPVAKPGQTVFIHETLTVDGKQIFSSREKDIVSLQ